MEERRLKLYAYRKELLKLLRTCNEDIKIRCSGSHILEGIVSKSLPLLLSKRNGRRERDNFRKLNCNIWVLHTSTYHIFHLIIDAELAIFAHPYDLDVGRDSRQNACKTLEISLQKISLSPPSLGCEYRNTSKFC